MEVEAEGEAEAESESMGGGSEDQQAEKWWSGLGGVRSISLLRNARFSPFLEGSKRGRRRWEGVFFGGW